MPTLLCPMVNLTVTAGGNIYLGRIRDAGLVGGLDAPEISENRPSPQGWRTTKPRLCHERGISSSIRAPEISGRPQAIPDLGTLMGILPASFEARADKGTIQIRSNRSPFFPRRRDRSSSSAHQTYRRSADNQTS